MRIDIAAQTDIGRRKKNNEDCHGVFRDDTEGLRLFNEGAMLCVADGLGGHVGGEIASKLAVSMMRDMLKTEPAPDPEADPDDPKADSTGIFAALREGFRKANEGIFRTNQDLVRGGRPMGTTLLTAVITPRKAYIGNVGDSRCYHIRDGEIIDRTEDHSWVDEQVKAGLMSKSEAEKDNRKNIVTRCIGTQAEVEMDAYLWRIVPGDRLLLCTDGLVNMATDSEIVAEFRKNLAPAEIAQRLVALANENGGKDNITVLIADISPSPWTVLARRIRTFSRRRGARIVWTLLVVLGILLGYVAGFLTCYFMLVNRG